MHEDRDSLMSQAIITGNGYDMGMEPQFLMAA